MTATVPAGESANRGLASWFARLEDGAILRVAFFAMLAGTLAVLYIDYGELSEADVPGLSAPLRPVLPAFDPDNPMTPAGPSVTSDFDTLMEPLTVSLEAGGILALSGTIDPGAAERVAAEIDARGEYVDTVSLDSPGGAVEEALRIGRLISERGYTTRVAAGALCASSCPLVFAGGRDRIATAASAIGVHQVYAAIGPGALPVGARAAGEAMSDAQRTTAAITRHLTEMGVDPALWLHALETPPDRLYYLSPTELEAYRLATAIE